MPQRFDWRELVDAARRALSVRIRLVLLVVIAIAPLLYDRVRTLEMTRADQLAAAGAQALEFARISADRQEELLNAARSLLQTVSHSVAHLPAPSRECNRLLADVASDSAWTKALTLFDSRGKAVCASDPRSIGLDISDRAYFQQALSNGGLHFSGLIHPRTGLYQPSIAAAYGRRNQAGGPESVLVAITDLSWLGQMASAVETKAGALALLVDPNGVVVSGHPHRDAWSGRDLSTTALFRHVMQESAGTLTDSRLDGISRVWGFVPVATSGAHLLVGVDEREVLARINHDASVAYMQLAMVVILILLGAWTFGEHAILRPIRSLARAAERIGRGDLSVRTGGQVWAREFLPLTHSLDRMAQRLATREHSLRRESDRFRELAAIDALTGLSNRRSFDADLEAAWQDAAALGEPMALLMIDVDHFKRYNDTYGHVAGDAGLRSIGRVLAGVVGGSARAARYGGEEFALLLPGAGESSARDTAEMVRQAVKALEIPHGEAPSGVVTVSIGLAALTPTPADRIESLVTAADSALYASKRSRDRVTAYAPASLALAS
ncbi:MAG: diguanylate cyclase [Variibacter sp.]|nr:diguanylate cyclase [Variibacter sp.]